MLNERDQYSAPDEPLVDPDPTLGPEAFARARLEEERDRGRVPLPADPRLATAAGLEECGPEELHVPELRIKQSHGEATEAVGPGEWYLAGVPEVILPRELSLVVLEVRRERALVLGSFDVALEARVRERAGTAVVTEVGAPVCSSRDRVQPDQGEGLFPLSTDCASCPFSRWRVEAGQRVQDCREGLSLLVVEGEQVAEYHARGPALRPVRELLAWLQVACRRDRAPACAYRVGVYTTEVQGPDGPLWVPWFDDPRRIEDSHQVARWAELRGVFSATCGEEG